SPPPDPQPLRLRPRPCGDQPVAGDLRVGDARVAVLVIDRMPARIPVSSALDIQTSSTLTPEVRHALAQLDSVHTDGQLPTVAVEDLVGSGDNGTFDPGPPMGIYVNPSGR